MGLLVRCTLLRALGAGLLIGCQPLGTGSAGLPLLGQPCWAAPAEMRCLWGLAGSAAHACGSAA